jgi:hypothetical protein
MNRKELYGLKYFIGYCVVVIGFFLYSGIVGYKWFNPTQTEPSRPAGGRGGHIYRSYHK